MKYGAVCSWFAVARSWSTGSHPRHSMASRGEVVAVMSDDIMCCVGLVQRR